MIPEPASGGRIRSAAIRLFGFPAADIHLLRTRNTIRRETSPSGARLSGCSGAVKLDAHAM
jgi:hypothetical protein